MTLSDILNADVAQIGQMARQGWSWWVETLASLVPARLRAGGPQAPIAELDADGQGYRLIRDGSAVHHAGPTAGGRTVVLRLDASTALWREAELPLLSGDDTRRLVALELDRLMPFPADTAVHAFEVAGRDPARRRQTIRLAAASRATAQQAVARAQALGLTPVGLRAGDCAADLLPGLTRGGASREGLYWGVAVAALIGVNLFLLVYRDIAETRRLRDLVDAQRPAATVAIKLRQMALAEDSGRRDLLARREAQSALTLLSGVNGAIPPGAWVHRLAWNGHVVRLSGLRDPAVDVLGALRRSPRFVNARNADQQAQALTPGAGKLPYDIAADAASPSPTPAPGSVK